jgi:hypothetical protein
MSPMTPIGRSLVGSQRKRALVGKGTSRMADGVVHHAIP